MAGYMLALDHSTTSSRALVFDPEGVAVTHARQELRQIYPQSGWVEYDPMGIWFSQRNVAGRALHQSDVLARDINAIGITNQRETTLLWERTSGQPVYNAIGWQCRRSTPQCKGLAEQGLAPEVRAPTGLVIDAYFSATKLQWLFEHVSGLRQRATRGELCFGTVDSWIVKQMTRGRLHVTHASNAARTMLYNIHQGVWDATLPGALQIPLEILLEVCPSSCIYRLTNPAAFLGATLPIASLVGGGIETTACAAAYLAGLATGVWSSQADIATHWQEEARFFPRLSAERREELYTGWRQAVERAKGWASPETANS
jgi:glycerol kinase